MNKGFTLVEVLAVIIVLSALILVVAIVVKPVVDTSKENLSDVQIKNIESAAKSYYIKEGMESDFIDIEEIRSCVNVEDLIESGYIDKDEIMDPEKEETVDGSVKIIYRANNYSYEYQDKKCTNYDRGIICERVESTEVGNIPLGKLEPGDAYNCKVAPNREPYKFYVLSTNEDGTVNLIMDSNINKNGEPINSNSISDKGIVEWIKEEDFLLEGGGGAVTTIYGPVTAMNYLESATSKWTNLNKITINTFDDELDNIYDMKEYNMYARMPYKNEVEDFSESVDYLYNNIEAECRRNDDYLLVNCNTSNSFVSNGVHSKGMTHVDGVHGYWTLTSSTTNYGIAYFAWQVLIHGQVWDEYASINLLYDIGVRPVITIYKFQIE